MNDAVQLRMFFSMFAMSAPVLLVCVIAILAIASNWKRLSTAAIWAAAGFGLALLLCFVVPLVQSVVQTWVTQGGNIGQRASLLGGLSVLWSLLRGVTYVFLLMAIIMGRAKPQPGT